MATTTLACKSRAVGFSLASSIHKKQLAGLICFPSTRIKSQRPVAEPCIRPSLARGRLSFQGRATLLQRLGPSQQSLEQPIPRPT